MSLFINGLFTGILKPDAVVGGSIAIYENAWTDTQGTINNIEAECKNPDSGAYWMQAETVGAGAFQNMRTNKLLPVTHLGKISNNITLQQVHNQYNMLLTSAIPDYVEQHQMKFELWHEDYAILKYGVGEEYKQHFDGSTSSGRAISAICYLNNDFEGGEIEFVHFGIKISPQPGMLILFPSNYAYAHIAHAVTKGTKYALVTWLRDRHLDRPF